MEFLRSIIDVLSSAIVLGKIELPFSWMKLALSAMLSIVFYLAYRVFFAIEKKLLGKSRIKHQTLNQVFRWSRIAFRILFLLSVLFLIGWLFGARMFEYLGKIFGVLAEPLISSGSTHISFLTILLTIPVFYLASWAGRMSRSFMNRSLLNRVKLDESRRFSITSLVRYGVMVIVVLVGLSILGIDLSALTVLFGVLGIGIGFGLQAMVANFFAGMVIILTRPVKEGDRILVDGMDATVVHIRLLSTIINTVTKDTIIIPNSLLVNNSVRNYSYDTRQIIIKNQVSVSYNSDLDTVITVLEGIGRDSPFAASAAKVEVRITDFGNSGIGTLLLTEIADADDKFKAQSWANFEIWRRFADSEIKIPFPQVDLHVIDQKEEFRVRRIEVEDNE